MVKQHFLTVWLIDESQNNAEVLASGLRNAGHRIQSTLLSRRKDLKEALEQGVPDFVLCATELDGLDLSTCVELINEASSAVPVIGVAEEVTPEAVAEALTAGARDLVSRSGMEHLQGVVTRELKVIRQWRQLREAEQTAAEARQQTESFLAVTSDAVAYTTEGIHAEVNAAYAHLFGFELPAEVEGLPVMDFVSKDDQATLKQRLREFDKGTVSEEPLEVQAVRVDGGTFPAEIYTSEVLHDGERSLQILIPARNTDSSELLEQYEGLREKHAALERKYQLLTVEHAKLRRKEASFEEHRENLQAIDQTITEQTDEPATGKLAATGLPDRGTFFASFRDKLAELQQEGGQPCLAYILVDRYDQLVDQLGFGVMDGLIGQLSKRIGERLEASDFLAQCADSGFILLGRRQDRKTALTWAEDLVAGIGETILETNSHSRQLSVSLGLNLMEAEQRPDPETVVMEALGAARKASAEGGAVRETLPALGSGDSGGDAEAELAARVRAALDEDRFTIVHQPIASLDGNASNRMDVRVRMLDDAGEEVPPARFIPAARRAGLMRDIDRWVVDQTVRLVEEQAGPGGGQLFIKLSAESLAEDGLLEWAQERVRRVGHGNATLMFEVTQEDVENHVKQVRSLARKLEELGSGLIVDHFGVGEAPLKVLDWIPVRYVKLDGSFMDNLAADENKMERFREITQKAREKRIESIAGHVEDAHGLAVLWQLGVNYIQGNYVQEPEVVLGSSGTWQWTGESG